jgi:YidC/Oxa1 family membrane protein insertase
MGFIGDIFDLILINPLTNLFVFLTAATGNAGFGVILLTIFIRLVTLPLTLKQMHSMRMMAVLAPRLQDVNKRFKDPRRRQQETMKLYKEAGVNPLGCVSGMLLQFPILIALYRVFNLAVGESPEALIAVSDRIYPWEYLQGAFPLPAEFLWLHLGRPDPLIIPILVGITTYTLQKMTMMPSTDERVRAQNRMMNLMMPLIFGWITITLPSGLGLYYVLSNLIGMVMQYAYVGGGPINIRAFFGSEEPVLPRSLVVRQRQADAMKKIGESEDTEAQPTDQKNTASGDGASAAARRRRRYTSGRRRGRR